MFTMCKILSKVDTFNIMLNLPNKSKLYSLKLGMAHAVTIGVDLAGILGVAWRAPKVSECGMGKGVSSPAD